MDHEEEPLTGGPDGSDAQQPEGSGRLSAAYLPYDDERLWLGMPEEQRRRPRARKPRPVGRPGASAWLPADGSLPSRILRLARPTSFGRRQIAAAVLTLALPISAFTVTGLLSDDVEVPTASVQNAEPTLTPTVVTIDLEGLRAKRVSPDHVRLVWEAPALDGPVTYSIYRDGIVIAEATDTRFVDRDVRPQSYYYYAVAAIGSDGRTAASPQLLVAVPSESGELPEGPAPAPPAPIVVVPTSTSPSPTTSPRPSGSKVVWPSSDFGGGSGGSGGGGGGTTDPCLIDPQSSASCPNYDPCIADPQSSSSCPGYDPCIADPQSSSSCPGYDPCLANPSDPACVPAGAVALPPPPTLVPLLPLLPFRRRRRVRERTGPATTRTTPPNG